MTRNISFYRSGLISVHFIYVYGRPVCTVHAVLYTYQFQALFAASLYVVSYILNFLMCGFALGSAVLFGLCQADRSLQWTKETLSVITSIIDQNIGRTKFCNGRSCNSENILQCKCTSFWYFYMLLLELHTNIITSMSTPEGKDRQHTPPPIVHVVTDRSRGDTTQSSLASPFTSLAKGLARETTRNWVKILTNQIFVLDPLTAPKIQPWPSTTVLLKIRHDKKILLYIIQAGGFASLALCCTRSV